MKKAILLAVFLMSVLPVSAHACEMLQALFSAKVQAVEPLQGEQCRVLVSWEGHWTYSPAYSCPLDIDEVSSFGVITTCDFKVGESVSGMAYRSNNATPQFIYLY